VTLGLAALFARCGDGNGVMAVSLVVLPVHSLQLNSDADLLRCFRSEEHLDSKLSFPFSVRIEKNTPLPSLIGNLIKLFIF
jgi:hypothetical protein